MKNIDILICANGKKHIVEAHEFLKKHKDLPNTIYVSTDQPESFKGYNTVYNDNIGYLSKINAIKLCPSDNFIYIDCDTHIYSLDDAEYFFSTYDICASLEPLGHTETYFGVPSSLDYKEDSLPEFQTGVIFFNRCNEVNEFIDKWYSYHKKMSNEYAKYPDQHSFKVTQSELRLKVGILPNNYNFRSCYQQYIVGQVYIAHSRIPKPHALQNKFIKSSRPRIYICSQISVNIGSAIFKVLNLFNRF